jgi:hypothetical protein
MKHIPRQSANACWVCLGIKHTSSLCQNSAGYKVVEVPCSKCPRQALKQSPKRRASHGKTDQGSNTHILLGDRLTRQALPRLSRPRAVKVSCTAQAMVDRSSEQNFLALCSTSSREVRIARLIPIQDACRAEIHLRLSAVSTNSRLLPPSSAGILSSKGSVPAWTDAARTRLVLNSLRTGRIRSASFRR